MAAVPEAIGFEKAPSTLFGEEYDRRVAAGIYDPIVYHEHGSAVAIIAQFGDFPIEKEAVGKGADSTHSFIPFVHPVAEPQNALGPAYDLKALTFVPSIPPHPLGVERWTYYPRADVVRQVDSP